MKRNWRQWFDCIRYHVRCIPGNWIAGLHVAIWISEGHLTFDEGVRYWRESHPFLKCGLCDSWVPWWAVEKAFCTHCRDEVYGRPENPLPEDSIPFWS